MLILEQIIYDFFIRAYYMAILLASPFNPKAKLWILGRRNWKSHLTKRILTLPEGKRYWFHCASLGEFEQARPLIEKLKLDSHNFEKCDSPVIILTFFSPSGFEVRKHYQHADIVMYLPLDTAKNATIFLDLLHPSAALFVKYEFWHHFLTSLKHRKITTVLFSSVFRENQIFFKRGGEIFRNMLRCFTKIYVQNESSERLLSNLGIESEIAYDTRFDRVNQIAETRSSMPLIEKFRGNAKIFLAGSTWAKDEKILTDYLNGKKTSAYKYIIAPHVIKPDSINHLLQIIRMKTNLLSNLNEENAANTEVLIVNSIGQLASLYSYASIAYVGGGFDGGIHNVLEPAVFGIPIITGPNIQKSEEAKTLHSLQALFTLNNNVNDLSQLVQMLTENHEVYSTACKESKNYVTGRLGGTDLIYEYVSKL